MLSESVGGFHYVSLCLHCCYSTDAIFHIYTIENCIAKARIL
jgi:hypothetical protein